MAFRSKVVWEDQGQETILLNFDLEGDSRIVETAFEVKDGKAGVDPAGPVGAAGQKLTDAVLSFVARARQVRDDLIRLIVNQVGDGVVVCIYGSPGKPGIKAMDVDDDAVRMDLAVVFEQAAVFAKWKGVE